jgi:hypothetical protein
LEDLEPAFALVAAGKLSGVTTAYVQDLHVIDIEGLELILDHYVY